MPLRKKTRSLRTLSIIVLGDNWDRLCYNCSGPTEMSDLLENDTYLDFQGPFDSFPSSLLQDMMQVIGGRKSLTRKFLHLLIREQLEVLNLGFGTGEEHYGLQFLSRCKKLKRLNLAYLHHIQPEKLLALMPKIQNLVVLNLQMTLTIDQVMEAIGVNCANLRELNVTSTLISDDGIYRLSGADSGRKQCQKLQRLIVSDTRVSWLGACCALEKFPELTDFDYDKIFEVFEHLDPNACLDGDKVPYKLRTLCSVSPCLRADSIDAAATMCPRAEVVSLSNAWIGNETLYKIMRYENLRSLSLVNNEGETMDFYEGVLPVLQVVGPNLDNLILNRFASVDLISLGRSCPILQKLATCNIGRYETQREGPAGSIFSRLAALELWLDNRTEHGSDVILKQLLHSCENIANLLLKKCAGFHLPVLEEIWRTNRMRKLARLTLDECSNASMATLMGLMLRDNDLSTIRIWSCPQFPEADYRELKAFAARENCDTYIEWFS